MVYSRSQPSLIIVTGGIRQGQGPVVLRSVEVLHGDGSSRCSLPDLPRESKQQTTNLCEGSLLTKLPATAWQAAGPRTGGSRQDPRWVRCVWTQGSGLTRADITGWRLAAWRRPGAALVKVRSLRRRIWKPSENTVRNDGSQNFENKLNACAA